MTSLIALSSLLAAGSLVVWRLPLLLSGESSGAIRLAMVAILVASAVVLWWLRAPASGRLEPRLTAWTVALLVVLAFGLLRAGQVGAMPWTQVLLQGVQWSALAFFACLIGRWRQAAGCTGNWVTSALFCYIGINVLLMLAGWENPRIEGSQGVAQMLAALGIGADRVAFPTAEGLNNFGTIAGATLLAGLVGLRERRGATALAGTVVIALTGLSAVLLTDSRIALLAAAAVAAIACTLPRRYVFAAAVVTAVVMAAIPPALMEFSSKLEQVKFADALSRGQSDLTTVNTRDQVWYGAMTAHVDGSLKDRTLGFGAFGQSTSGATAFYQHLFSRNIEAPTVHNMVLQHLLDGGYVGVVILCGLLWSVMRHLGRAAAQGLPQARTLLALTVYLLVTGVSEATATMYHPESLALLLLVIGMAAAMPASATARDQGIRRWRMSPSASEGDSLDVELAPAPPVAALASRSRGALWRMS